MSIKALNDDNKMINKKLKKSENYYIISFKLFQLMGNASFVKFKL